MQAVEKKHLKVCYKQLMLAKLGNEGKLDVLLVCVRPCVFETVRIRNKNV